MDVGDNKVRLTSSHNHLEGDSGPVTVGQGSVEPHIVSAWYVVQSWVELEGRVDARTVEGHEVGLEWVSRVLGHNRVNDVSAEIGSESASDSNVDVGGPRPGIGVVVGLNDFLRKEEAVLSQLRSRQHSVEAKGLDHCSFARVLHFYGEGSGGFAGLCGLACVSVDDVGDASVDSHGVHADVVGFKWVHEHRHLALGDVANCRVRTCRANAHQRVRRGIAVEVLSRRCEGDRSGAVNLGDGACLSGLSRVNVSHGAGVRQGEYKCVSGTAVLASWSSRVRVGLQTHTGHL